MSVRALCCAVVCLTLATPVLAAPATTTPASDAPMTRNGDQIELDMVSHKLSVPLPDWLSDSDKATDDLKSVLETAFVGGASQAQVEWFPKGQNQASWTTRYGAQLLLQPNAPLPKFRAITMRSFAATCPKANIGFFQTELDDGEKLPPLGFICDNYGQASGPLAGLGEIALLAFRKTDSGVSLVYEDWRGPAFDATKPATWPISPDALQARSATFNAKVSLVSAN